MFDNAACLGGRKGAASGFLHTAEPSHLQIDSRELIVKMLTIEQRRL